MSVKMITLFVSMFLCFSEVGQAQSSNLILPGETKTFRTHGARRIQVTCVDQQTNPEPLRLKANLFYHYNCQSFSYSVDITGDIETDRAQCLSKASSRRDLIFRSVEIDGICRNDDGSSDIGSGERLCMKAAEIIRFGERRGRH